LVSVEIVAYQSIVVVQGQRGILALVSGNLLIRPFLMGFYRLHLVPLGYLFYVWYERILIVHIC